MMDEANIYEQIIRHMWKNSFLSNCGYDDMTDDMKRLFNRIVGEPVSDRNC